MHFYKTKHSQAFILASPRSGTTWLSKMLNAHPAVYCTENRLFGMYADFIQDDHVIKARLRVTLDKYVDSLSLHANVTDLGLTRSDFQKEMLQMLIRSMNEFYIKASHKKILVDKITPYIGTSELVGQKLEIFSPDSPVVFLIRDGRDVCTSGIFHWLKKRPANREYSAFEEQRRAYFLDDLGPRPEKLFMQSEIIEWARTWTEPLELISKFEGKRPVHILHYEQLLEDPNQAIGEMFHFLKIKRTGKIIEDCISAGSFQKMTDGRRQGIDMPGQHIRKGVKGDWTNFFSPEDEITFDRIAGKQLVKFRYK